MLFKLSLVALIALVVSVSCSLQGRVINGTKSDIKKYRFMVSLLKDGERHFCGGTFVTGRFILTAAHCVIGKMASEISIQYGTTARSADSKNVIKVKRIIIHENYDIFKIYDYDIALLELEKTIVNDLVRSVNIPELLFKVPQNKNGASGVVLGWGVKSDFGPMEDNLQEVELKIYSDEECKKLYKDYINIKLICAGGEKGSMGACYGDSGGPLLFKNSLQLGIVSSCFKPCASSPGIYTKVSFFSAWIAENIK